MASATKTRQKIELLQALVDHPKTGEAEREAARRAIERAHTAAADQGVKLTSWVDTRKYGSKYEQVSTLNLVEIAALMRADVKLARKLGAKAAEPEAGAVAILDAIGTMPAGIKVSIRSRYYSGGGSIDIRLKDIPRDWGFVQKLDIWDELRWVPSPALDAVLKDLRVIHWAYNFDGGDAYTDYSFRNYLGGVDYERPYDRAS